MYSDVLTVLDVATQTNDCKTQAKRWEISSSISSAERGSLQQIENIGAELGWVIVPVAVDLPEWHDKLTLVLLAPFAHRFMRRAKLIVWTEVRGSCDRTRGRWLSRGLRWFLQNQRPLALLPLSSPRPFRPNRLRRCDHLFGARYALLKKPTDARAGLQSLARSF